MNTGKNGLPRIVIVGGGAGGLELATRLGKSIGKDKKAEIFLIDATLTHIWKPLLHEVASGTLNSFEDELNYFAHAKKNHFEFYLGRMTDLDRENKHIVLGPLNNGAGEIIAPERTISYDTLVIAVGSTSNDFGTKGAQDNCIFLDARAQADRFQREFLSLYLQAQAKMLFNESPQHQSLNIAIIGAGATGVELAAELHQASHKFSQYGLNSISPKNVHITLIEAANRILPGLPERISAKAEEELVKMGINVRTNSRVTEIDAHKVVFDGGEEIRASLKVWAAGIKAPAFLKDLAGLESNRINQLVVGPTLQTTVDPDIFAMGDCSCYIPKGTDRPVPPRAQVANQQSIFLKKALIAKINGQVLPEFTFKDKGSLVSLSEKSTVGHVLGNINIEGLFARFMYISLYRMHQVALHGYFKTFVLIIKDLLSKSSGPHLKMH